MNKIIFLCFITSQIVIITIIFSNNLFAENSNTMKINIIESAPNINAKAYILIDYYSGKVLSEENSDQRHNPVSLTKMMTDYIICQTIKSGKININDIVTIDKNSWAIRNPILKGYSLMFLKPADRVSVS